MRVRFNGVIEKRKSGCPVCGSKAHNDSVFIRSKRYFMPSGRSVMFRAGEGVDVSDADAEFLLSYQYTDSSGVVRHVFEVE